MRELIAAYLEELREAGRAPATLNAAAHWLEHFERFCREQRLTLSALDRLALAAYHTRLLWQSHSRGRLYAPNSIDMGLRWARAFLRWAVARGVLRSDPAQHLVLGRPTRRPRPTWSRAERDAVLALPDLTLTAGLRDRALLGLVLNTELTWPQSAALDVADFDPDSHRLAAHRGRRRHGPVELVLSDELADLLTRYLSQGRPQLNPTGQEPALFLNLGGRRLTWTHMSHLVSAYMRQARATAFPLIDGP